MPRTLITGLCCLILFSAFHVVAVNTLTEQYAVIQKAYDEQEQLYALPTPILKIIALEYKQLVSDVLFIKGIVYIGGFVTPGVSKKKMTDSQWRAFYRSMDVTTDLDPYFQDPYYLTNAFLTWDGGMIREANTLLEKGSRYRDWDWMLPFFEGFNYFFFLDENDKASEKLMEASRRPGATATIASLAARMAFKAKKTENSIDFLSEIISKTKDAATKKQYEARLRTYQAILYLERAVEAYRHRFKKTPRSLGDLLSNNIIATIPKDSYGGTFYLDEKGNVKTTSEDKLLPYRKN